MSVKQSRPTVTKLCVRCGVLSDHAMRLRPAGNLTVESPCKKCRCLARRTMVRKRRGLPADAKLSPTAGRKIDGTKPRYCTVCGEFKQPEDFESFNDTRSGSTKWRGACRLCNRLRRQKSLTKLEAERGFARFRRQKACRVCNQLTVTKKGRRCRSCFLEKKAAERQAYLDSIGGVKPEKRKKTMNEVRAESERYQAKLRQSKPLKAGTTYMLVSSEERWVLSYQCLKCKRPILFCGKCYSCATGRQRSTVLTPPVVVGEGVVCPKSDVVTANG